MRRAFVRHFADKRRQLAEPRAGNRRQHERQHDGQHDVAHRPRHRHKNRIHRRGLLPDGLVGRGGIRPLRLGGSLRIDIRNRHVAAERDGAQAPFNAPEHLPPQHGAKPDREGLNPQTTPAGDQEVPEFMYENRKRKQQDASRNRQNRVQCLHRKRIIP